MFEIGNSLREARLRQQLDFPELEQQTKIRSKYLKALEDEKFDLLPAPTYVKGFLRNYADALGLEGQLYVDEYNSRFVTGEEETPLRPRDYQRRPQTLGPRFEMKAVLLVLIVITIIFALFIAAWKSGADKPRVQGLNAPGVPIVKPKHTTKPMVRLVLTANRDSWLLVRANSASGPTKYQGTFQQGQQLAFNKKPFLFRRLWIAAAKPQNVIVRLNGRPPVILGAGRHKATQYLVTPKSITKAPPAT
jgi:cytoskeleton protein RodZ